MPSRDEIVVTPLVDDDRVMRIVAGFLMAGFGRPANTVERFHASLRKRAGRASIPMTFVAFLNGKPVGTASLYVAGMGERFPDLTPWLGSVYVAPSYRRRGIGRLLCQAGVEECRRQGVLKVYLHTPNKEAYYRKLGWTTFRKIVHRGEQEVLMEYEPAQAGREPLAVR